MKIARLHGATTQKTAIFILTAVRTSNPPHYVVFSVSLSRIFSVLKNAFSLYYFFRVGNQDSNPYKIIVFYTLISRILCGSQEDNIILS
jgi:hypothetical protein